MPCRKRRPEATTGGRALLYVPGTDCRVPARDRSGRLSFGLGPRLHSTRGIAGREVESRGRPTETQCCCSSCSGCSCCALHSGRCLDCCSTTRHATHGLLLTCPHVQGAPRPSRPLDGLTPAAQQTPDLGDHFCHMTVLARSDHPQILAQSQVEAQFG
jgi:hypothetical protein